MADQIWRAIDFVEVDGVVIPGNQLKPIGQYDMNVEKGELQVTLRGKDIRVVYTGENVRGGRD